ncbi:MAG: S24/S26 family peptidase [Bryobacterales bacterium]|nr:S24/S26 family peptidase [Bryobacterales bacterium]
MKPLTVPCRVLMPLAREALCRGTHVRMTVTGTSMRPFIRDGDTVELAALGSKAVAVGDVVLAKRADGIYFLHRVVRVEGDRFYLAGDALEHEEGPFSGASLVGCVVNVQRAAKLISLQSAHWQLAGILWIKMGPLRPYLLRWAGRIKRAVMRFRAQIPHSFTAGMVRLHSTEKRPDVL